MDKKMNRRNFLKAGGAGIASVVLGGSGLLSWSPRAHAETLTKTLYITDGFVTMITGENVYFKGFSNASNMLNLPGESIIVQEGDTVELTIVNTLGSNHQFDINGYDGRFTLSNGDRVSVVNIPSGGEVSFSFVASDPGSYLYLDPSNAPYNRLVGLHGGLAIMPGNSKTTLYDNSPRFVQQHFWIFNDIDPVWHNAIRNGNRPNTPYVPRYFSLNGLGGRPPGAPGAHDPNIDAITVPRSALHGHIGDRTLIRMFNVGKADQSVHAHANHMEWLTENGQIRDEIWEKDCLYLESNIGAIDAIYPFESPPDAWPPVNTGAYPMHLHTEMSQTAGGGYYMFGAMTDIYFE